MHKLLKLIIGLLLVPMCWAVSRTVLSLLVSPVTGSMEWAFSAGFSVSAVGFVVLPPAWRTYVLGHELTHALWGLLMGARIGRMRVGADGGHVELSKKNFLISLAPYFFPFYTVVVLLLWWGCSLVWDAPVYEPWWMALVGGTWGFHLMFTVFMLGQRQPDIQEHGRIFSYVVIYLVNVLFVVVWFVAASEATAASAGRFFGAEVRAVYSALWAFVVAGKLCLGRLF